MRVFIFAIALMMAATSLFAQGFGGMAGVPAGSSLLVNTDKGLFALRAGVLAKDW